MPIANIAGIPIRLHWSFVALLTVYLAFTGITAGAAWGLKAALVAIALFTSVVLHELGHAMAALAYGIRTAHITLYPFGGIAAITRPPETPTQELVIALAGPLVNFALAVAGLLAWVAFGGLAGVTVAAINVVMGVFNLIPAFPMDGGRVLRALLTRRLGYYRASEVAIGVGRWFAWGFVVLGLVTWAPTLALVGGFLLFALSGERRRLEALARWQARATLFSRPRPVPPLA